MFACVPKSPTFFFLFLIKIEMQADVFQGDTDEQLIVFDDDRPDDLSDDDDPGASGASVPFRGSRTRPR